MRVMMEQSSLQSILAESSPSMGFNADEEKIEDLVQSGVIDPTKVVRVAIQNASSIAGLLLTTEALICELPEKPKGGAPCRSWPWRWLSGLRLELAEARN